MYFFWWLGVLLKVSYLMFLGNFVIVFFVRFFLLKGVLVVSNSMWTLLEGICCCSYNFLFWVEVFVMCLFVIFYFGERVIHWVPSFFWSKLLVKIRVFLVRCLCSDFLDMLVGGGERGFVLCFWVVCVKLGVLGSCFWYLRYEMKIRIMMGIGFIWVFFWYG